VALGAATWASIEKGITMLPDLCARKIGMTLRQGVRAVQVYLDDAVEILRRGRHDVGDPGRVNQDVQAASCEAASLTSFAAATGRPRRP